MIYRSARSLNEYIDIMERSITNIRADIAHHAKGNVTLLAATKTVPAEAVNYAIDNLGITDIGENRVQELLEKYDALHKERLNIHFIGRLQTNKVKYIIDKVCLIHSLDSEKLAAEIDRQARKIGKVMDVLVEINIGGEQSKGGISPENAEEFVDSLSVFTNIRARGLMVIPPATVSREEMIKYFGQTYKIFIDIFQKKLHNDNSCILSMGMSDSYIEALDCGSNLIRLGSALFGKRA